MGSKKNEVAKSFAQWTSKPHYSVTFNAGDHGVISGSNIVDRYEGQMITNTDVPVVKPNDHYIFKGWNPEFTEHAVTSNESYTAIYEYVAATIHFNTGENGETVNDIIVDRGSGISNVPRPRHKSGIFVGWCSDSGLQNVVDLSTWKMPTPAVETTFYAKWDLNAAKRVVSYTVNGGTASFTSVVKVLLDSDGWASTTGSFTLAENDIPTVTADATHEGDPTWSPRNPLGAVLSDATTFAATFAEKRVRVQVIGNEHVNIDNGDQTVVIGSAITPIVVKPKSGWGYGYSQDNLTSLSLNGLTATYTGYDNSITITGSLSADTTMNAPTCSASGDLTVVYVDVKTLAEVVGVIYSLTTVPGRDYITINGSYDLPNSTRIYGLIAGTNILVELVSTPERYGDAGVIGEYTVQGVADEVYIIHSALHPTIPNASNILEIHQNVVGSESSQLDYFRYNVTLNNELYKLYMRGTRDAILETTQESNTYNITQLDENRNGYTTSITSGSLTGTVDTNSGVPAILGVKHVKGNENMGSLLVNINTSSDIYTNQKAGSLAIQPFSCEITVWLSDKTFNNDQFTNGVGVFTINGIRPGRSGQITTEGLPTCNYTVDAVLTSVTWPPYTSRYFNRVETNTIGQIMNTTRSEATFDFNYNQATVFLTVDGENILSQSSSIGISLHDDGGNLLEDITDRCGSFNIVNGQCIITNAVSKFGQTLRFLQVPCAKLNIFADTDSLPWYGDVQVYKDGSLIDQATTFTQLEDNATYNFNIKYVIIPGVAKPDPNCNIADVQINGVSIESGATTFNWNQTLKLVYKNQLQTGGLNALWAAFGETEYTSLVTNLDASVNINTKVVEASWTGLEQAQYDLVNSLKDSKPYIQIYDENGLPSKFIIVNAGCTHKKTLHPELILNIDVSEVGGEGVLQNVYGVVKETPSSTPVNAIIYSQGGIGNPAYTTNNLKPFESVAELSKYTIANEVYLHTDTGTAPQYGKYETDYLNGWTRFSDGETVKYIPNYLDPITAQYKNVCYRIFGIESGTKTIDIKGQRLLSGDYADPADYQADSPINRPWPDPNNRKSCPIIHGDTLNFLIRSIDQIDCKFSDRETTLKFDIGAEINNYEMYSPDRYDLERIINDRVFKNGISKVNLPIKGIRVVTYTYPTLPVGNGLSTVPYTITCAIDIIPNSPGRHDIVSKNMVVFNDSTQDEDSLPLTITIAMSSGGGGSGGPSSGDLVKPEIPTDPDAPPGIDWD